MAETTIDSTGTVPGISRLSVSTSNSRGDANDEEENETNIIDDTINEDDEVEGGASNLGNSSDDEVWTEWLDANGGDPFVDDSIDEKVREEAGEHVEEEEIEDDEVEGGASNLGNSSDEDVVWREWLVANGGGPYADDSIDENVGEEADEQLFLLRVKLCQRLQRLGNNMNDSSDEEGWQKRQERLEYLLNNCMALLQLVDELTDSVDEKKVTAEMFRERLERLENIIADINWENSVDSNSDDSETDTDSSVDSETDTDSSVDSETDPASYVDFETDPATKQQIDALPTSVVSQELLGLFSKDFCSICFGEFELDQEIKHPPCTHIFHTECLSTWLGKDRRCPYCRMSCIA